MSKEYDKTVKDWSEAEDYLLAVEKAYSEIGSAGYVCLTFTIRPLRDRYNSGERTDDLWNSIMEVSL